MLRRFAVLVVVICAAVFAVFPRKVRREANPTGELQPFRATATTVTPMRTDAEFKAWQLWANRATVLAALFTALALFATVVVYFLAADREADANTVAIMRSHIQIFGDHPDLRSCASFAVVPADPKCLSVAEDAVFTAETIIRLRGDEPPWAASARSLICEYQWWFSAKRFNKPNYYGAFVTFVERELPKCRKSASPWPPHAPSSSPPR